jgi:glycosyltransferase involved in cell wall biosynthesis
MNRPDELNEALLSLKTSLAQPLEVIVSDDSREDLAERVRGVTQAHPGVIYLRGPRKGLSANRNACLKIVRGELVSFIDDDQKLHPEFLLRGPEEYIRLRELHGTERIIVTGNQTLPEGPLDPSNLNFLGFFTGQLPREGQPNAICIGAALIPAGLFRQAQFDENIFFGSEESDISFHAAFLGYRIIYVGSLTNYHYPSSVNRDLYEGKVLQSRLYFGLKRYWIYKRSLPRFLLFNLYAFVNAVGHCVKQLRFRESIAAVSAFLKAWKQFRGKLLELRSRT